MAVVIAVSLVLVVVLVWALYAEEVPPRPARTPRDVVVGPAAWDGPPDVHQIRRRDLPTRTFGGYDPAAVDAHLAAVAAAYGALQARVAELEGRTTAGGAQAAVGSPGDE